MDLWATLLSQLVDPFRIGITVALMLTMFRTRSQTGTLLPLAAGTAFIAVLIPTTLTNAQGNIPVQVAVGMVSGAILMAAALLVRALVLKVAGR